MKKILLALLCLTATVASQAQNETGTWTLTPKVGLNWAKISDGGIMYGDNQKASPTSKLGLIAGVEAEYRVLSGLGISAGLLYSQQGTVYDDAPKVWKDMKVSLDYLNLPVMAHVYVAPGLSVEAGLQPGYLIHSNTSAEWYTDESGWKSFSGNSSYHRKFDFGIPVGIAYDFDRLRLELRYCFGLYDTTKYVLKERNQTVQLTVGYRFSL